MLDMQRAREIASDWHSGQASPFYALSSSGYVDAAGIMSELRSNAPGRDTDKLTDPDLCELRDWIAPYADVQGGDLTYTDDDGVERFALDYLAIGAGDAPGSRYGTRSDEHTPIILAVARIFAESSGELTTSTLDSAASLVVNDSDGVATMIVDHGTDDDRDLLDDDVIAAAREQLAEQGY